MGGKRVFFSLESLYRQQKVSVLDCMGRSRAGDAQGAGRAAPVLLLPARGVMSAPASATTEAPGLGLLGTRRGAEGSRRCWDTARWPPSRGTAGVGLGGPCPKPGELGVPGCAVPGGPSSGWPGQRVQPRGVAAFLTRSLAGARAAGASLASACLIHRSPGRAGTAAGPAPRSPTAPRPLRPWVLRWEAAFLFSFWGVMGAQRPGGSFSLGGMLATTVG